MGDVVRTSYFCKPIKDKYPDAKLHWLTSNTSIQIINNNPYIDEIFTSITELPSPVYDIVYSLDDELNTLSIISTLTASKIVGGFLRNNEVTYSDDSSEWFDMGIHSKFGISQADNLKKTNGKTHSDIFKRIFDVDRCDPGIFYPDTDLPIFHSKIFTKKVIGINPFAGGRWKSKQLLKSELVFLLNLLLNDRYISSNYSIVLIGQGRDYEENLNVVSDIGITPDKLCAVDTSKSLYELMSLIGSLDVLITSDSLAMHLAISQQIKTIAFFSPTSSAEIDDFDVCTKIKSRRSDYCNYKPENDNSDITADRLFDAFVASIQEEYYLC